MSDSPFDFLVIGTGLAGLAGALTALEKSPGSSVCLLEKMRTPGNKFLIAGNGQCNITHGGPIEDFLSHYGGSEKERFVKPALLEYPNSSLLDFLRSGHLATEETDGGKIFPKSRKSADILSLLIRQVESRGGRIRCNESVLSVEKENDHFSVVTKSGTVYQSRAVLIAVGGQARPQTGTSGDGYLWAAKLGHKIITPRPALTSLEVDRREPALCSGISFFSNRIFISGKGKKAISRQGEVLLTHRGLSGPGILDSSRYIEPGDLLKIAIVPYENTEEFDKILRQTVEREGGKEVRSILRDFGVADRLVGALFQTSSLPADLRGSQLDKITRRKISELLTALPCRVTAVGGFDRAMVTAGGVALPEVDRKTMMSRRVPGLYFAGEVLDIDGDTGGYNLQFAWSSGSLAGKTLMSESEAKLKVFGGV